MRNQHQTDSRKKGVTKGLCADCGQPSSGHWKCDLCRATARQKAKQKNIDRRRQGLCVRCGSPAAPFARCKSCREYANELAKQRRDKRSADGVCCKCGGKVSGRKTCANCLLPARRFHRTVLVRRMEAGLCTQCGRLPPMSVVSDTTPYRQLCQTCYIKRKASSSLGSEKHWETLLAILERQDWRCKYTGEPLILGVNASVDHIQSRARFPELSDDPTNIEWTTLVINQVKRDLTPKEFLLLVKQVHDHCEL